MSDNYNKKVISVMAAALQGSVFVEGVSEDTAQTITNKSVQGHLLRSMSVWGSLHPEGRLWFVIKRSH